MVVIQAINDEMNEFPLILITFGTLWLQELPINHTMTIRINKNK